MVWMVWTGYGEYLKKQKHRHHEHVCGAGMHHTMSTVGYPGPSPPSHVHAHTRTVHGGTPPPPPPHTHTSAHTLQGSALTPKLGMLLPPSPPPSLPFLPGVEELPYSHADPHGGVEGVL